MKRLYLVLAALLALHTAFAQRKGFAIVIDPASQREAQTELNAYIQALEEVQNYHVYTVQDRWGVPDSIRAELQRLYRQKPDPIVGAVFIGDIPVPMVRDAQFLTSAFKMNQQMPWVDSSVPSDRFYDDFGLAFRFLKRDSVKPHLFYYSLTYEGDQHLQPELFTGRIRPTDSGGTSRYDKLRQYLRKATEAKRHPEPLQAVFTYTGSGSLNESRVAHIAEQQLLHEHFPQLEGRSGAFSYMDYGDRPFIKRKLMNEMMRPDLSIGLMHHHGDFDTQYLTHYPKPSGSEQALEYLMYCYRARLQSALRYGQNVDSIRQLLTERDHLPEAWLKGEPSPENLHKDSLMEDSLNLTLKDFATYGYRPNCRVAVYDACYNGAFHNDDCIANEYIFQPGRTIAGLGGTVNVLQDKWPDRYLGLLSHGVTIGEINQMQPELEMHVVGDPTFLFANEGGDGLTADEQCLKLNDRRKPLSDERLLETLRTSPWALVRIEAFKLLEQRGSDRLTEAIKVAAADNCELLQRFAVNAMPKSGDPQLAPALARLIAQNNTSARVAFNAMEAVQFFPQQDITEAVSVALDSIRPYVTWPDEYVSSRRAEVNKYAGRWADDIGKLCEGKANDRQARRLADMMKIYLAPYLAEDVARYTAGIGDQPELQCLLLSSLGWHRLGYRHKAVCDIVEQMTRDKRLTDEVKHEAIKTLKRLKVNK
ncbi:MAG: HEAT repeat domain-containing protein [Prevotella sp.]|nr:HEAT repeat domain-containing protein [Prevotella sp.]